MNTTPDGTPHGAPQNGPETGHQVFNWVRSTGLYRLEDSWVGGVFAAVAQKLSWDANLVRGLGIVAFILFTSPMLMFYGLGWLLLPDARGRIHAQEALRGSYPSAFWGASILTFLGAVNIFTPNVVGPFAILLNLVIIGLVGWFIWSLICNQDDDEEEEDPSDPQAEPSDPQQTSGQAAEPTEQGGTPRRADGKPAWYPKEDPKPEPTPPVTETSYASSSAPTRPQTQPEPRENPVQREQQRRRRLVTFGVVLLAVPMVAGAAWFATRIGLATTPAVLLALAAVVILLALMHLTAAFRGTPGRAGLLATFTALMMLVYFIGPVSTSSTNVFGNYNTSEGVVNTAFANTTMDQSHLNFDEANALDSSDFTNGGLSTSSSDYGVEVANAFGNTDVVVPDDVYIHVEPTSVFGNVEIRTVDEELDQSGFSLNSFGVGSEEAIGAVEVSVNNAFGNVSIYDETTYDQEEHGILDDGDDQLEDTQ